MPFLVVIYQDLRELGVEEPFNLKVLIFSNGHMMLGHPLACVGYFSLTEKGVGRQVDVEGCQDWAHRETTHLVEKD